MKCAHEWAVADLGERIEKLVIPMPSKAGEDNMPPEMTPPLSVRRFGRVCLKCDRVEIKDFAPEEWENIVVKPSWRKVDLADLEREDITKLGEQKEEEKKTRALRQKRREENLDLLKKYGQEARTLPHMEHKAREPSVSAEANEKETSPVYEETQSGVKRVLPAEEGAYEVVLSFAGEDREYVEKVAEFLRENNVRVFYDGYEEVKLWGKELTEYFDKIYRGSARYCVMFVSKYYANKVWTIYERRCALAKAIQEKEEYILPARFDDTELLGIRSTVGYVDLKKKSPQELAEMILQKWVNST